MVTNPMEMAILLCLRPIPQDKNEAFIVVDRAAFANVFLCPGSIPEDLRRHGG
jgi:hypothetical protein